MHHIFHEIELKTANISKSACTDIEHPKIVSPFTKGEKRERVKISNYQTIIQGFISWFMLTIFSVSLISQLLN